MGGAVMLEAEKLLSDRTIGLIAVDSLIQKSGYERLEENIIKQAIQPYKENFMQAINKLIDSFMSEKIDQDMIKAWKKEVEKLDSEEMIKAFEDMLRWDMKDSLSEIDKPIRSIIAGRTLTTEELRETHKQLFDTVFMEDLGHLLALEDSEAFNKVLDEMISDLTKLSP
jgi:pimeloyl-ACP methyl ester carboxylesterase